ncbi:MAG: mechanosensitive ion channel family protein [Bacteroidetes bacterium]|nr:mechanosensitive ion channel family protein [Bacteroidota bacterium]
MTIFEQQIAGNALYDWLIALGIAIGLSAILLLTKRILATRLARLAQRTTTGVDDMFVASIDRINPLFLLVLGLYSGSWWLSFSSDTRGIIDHVFFIAILIQAGIWAGKVLNYLITKGTRLREYEDPAAQTSLNVLGFMSGLLLWSIIFLIILDNLGVNITTLIASLGIGGIAVALAAQGILAELFASLSIAMDKPFVIGDFIVIDGFMGSVEKIGMRTTQIRSLGGEMIIFSNTDLLKSRIRNYKRMEERRILFTLDVVYGTPAAKVESIPSMVKEIIESDSMARFDRAHFKGYGSSSLVYEFVYYVLSREYNDYMDVQQRINFGIYQRFESEGIGFAFPTQTLHIDSMPRFTDPGQEESPDSSSHSSTEQENAA